MKAYLAARYPRRDEIKGYSLQLAAIGLETTSRWLDEKCSLQSNMKDHPKNFHEYTAKIDIEDVDAADILVFFAEDPLIGIPRGGRHVEYGYALAKGKKIYVIGDYENVFHHMPNVFHYDSLNSFMDWYKENYAQYRPFVQKAFTTRRRCGSRQK